MEVNELLMEQVLHSLREQGIKASRGSIYYLEKKNLVHPSLIEVGTRKKRLYSWADYQLIAKAIRYTNMGLTVDVACELLMNPPDQYAWFLIRTRPGMACRFVNAIRAYNEVRTAAAIWGSFYDALLKVGIWHRIDRDVLLYREFPRWGGIAGAYQVYELRNFIFSKESTGADDQVADRINAHVFLDVPEEHKDDLAGKLVKYDHVQEMAEVSGEMNIIIKLEVEDKKELDHIAMEIIRNSSAAKMKTYLSIAENYTK